MKTFYRIFFSFFLFFILAHEVNVSLAATSPKTKVKYKKGKNLNFESLLIEGEQKKPEMSVVTRNVGEKDLGLLKLRTKFTDYMENDSGEKIQ